MRKVLLIGFLGLLLTFYVNAQRGEHHHEHHKEHVEPDATTEASPSLGICPVMGQAASKDYSYVHEGKTYYFCCPSCIEEFKKNPANYISRTKEFSLEAYQFGYEPEEIRVKKGDIVRLWISSRDVSHGVYIKDYNVNVTAKKERSQKVEFIADKAGEFPILCSVYCGRGHHSMKAKLVVE